MISAWWLVLAFAGGAIIGATAGVVWCARQVTIWR